MSVVMEKGDREDLVLENASLLEVAGDGVKLSSLFDPPITVSGARVAKIDFINGKVLLEQTNRE